MQPQIYNTLDNIPESWSSHYSEDTKQLQLRKLNSLPSNSYQPLVVTHTLCVQENLKLSVFIHGNKRDHIFDTPLSAIPSTLDPPLCKLIAILDTAQVFPGNPDEHFIPLANAHNGEFNTLSGDVKVHVEKWFLLEVDGDVYQETIRTASCSLLVGQGKCISYKAYRPQLRSMHSRFLRKTAITAKYANNRYLNTPEKLRKRRNYMHVHKEAQGEN